MITKNRKLRLNRLVQKLNGATTEYNLADYRRIVAEIHRKRSAYASGYKEELRDYAQKIRAQHDDKAEEKSELVSVFALVFEIILRTLQLTPYDEQLIAAIALHQGKVAEMQTGEGKTLAAVFAVCLNALSGKGVHVLTFNDYLATRDARWMGPVYDFFGFSVGIVQEGMPLIKRKKAYQCDITYLTAKEAGFDFLRDSLCFRLEDTVQRPFYCALCDEADSILIDEARIPLVIAGSTNENESTTQIYAELARKMRVGIDFEFDEYQRNFHLTERGTGVAEKTLRCGNLYAAENIDLLTNLNCAIHAQHLLHKDVDYIVRNDAIELVDAFTGRVADKRRWPDGLQAALEAKENRIKRDRGKVLNSITLQHFLQLYPKLSGMTATAQVSAEELTNFYNLTTVVIPPHKPCIRQDNPDIIFQTKAEKLQALVAEITSTHKTGRPVLVGTSSVEESEKLAQTLIGAGIPCSVLNAKNDAQEAKIIAQAGRRGVVTISTNMAGRGVDIQLGAGNEKEKQAVQELGGLYVIGTNRHESERIDRQLRGRAGRQGDPGSSRFFVSLEDALFVQYRLGDLLPGPLEYNHPKRIKAAGKNIRIFQKIIEGQNLEIKKTLVRYASLIDKQRHVLYQRRRLVLEEKQSMVFWRENNPVQYQKLVAEVGEIPVAEACKSIEMYCIDQLWCRHLEEIHDLREGIHLLRLGGQDPAFEFQKLAIALFEELLANLEREMIRLFNSLVVKNGTIDLESVGVKAPSATWTYLINDNPYENIFGIALIGNAGMSLSIGAVMWTPLLAIYLLWKKLKSKLER